MSRPPENICIAGSGPTAVSAAHLLIKKGLKVTIIDPGLTLEESRRHLALQTGSVSRIDFLEQINTKASRSSTDDAMLPTKLAFGSDFMYRNIPETAVDFPANVRILSSLARGGLSNTWGANVCAVSDQDLAAWPIKATDLHQYFHLLEEIVQINGRTDAIDQLYATTLSASQRFPLGKQGKALLDRASAWQQELKDQGIHCGQSKLAIGPKYASNTVGCVHCGLCMYGCPYNAVFNSADVVDELKTKGLTYRPGYLVIEFEEKYDHLLVYIQNIETKKVEKLKFRKLILAAGVFASTAIVARSLNLLSHTFKILDSQKYLLPFVSYKRCFGVMTNPENTLAQIYIQFSKLQTTSNLVSLQLYGYNDLILSPLRKLLKAQTIPISKLLSPALERIMIGMIYLHSNDSGSLTFRVKPIHHTNEVGLGSVCGEPNPKSDLVFDEVVTMVNRNKKAFGGRLLSLAVNKNLPGNSQHFGGTFPMAHHPGVLQSDILGRPAGCRLVHLVDASILPSVTATPTTYPLMANALRIADHIVKDSYQS